MNGARKPLSGRVGKWERSKCSDIGPCDEPATVVIDDATGIGVCERHAEEHLRLALLKMLPKSQQTGQS